MRRRRTGRGAPRSRPPSTRTRPPWRGVRRCGRARYRCDVVGGRGAPSYRSERHGPPSHATFTNPPTANAQLEFAPGGAYSESHVQPARRVRGGVGCGNDARVIRVGRPWRRPDRRDLCCPPSPASGAAIRPRCTSGVRSGPRVDPLQRLGGWKAVQEHSARMGEHDRALLLSCARGSTRQALDDRTRGRTRRFAHACDALISRLLAIQARQRRNRPPRRRRRVRSVSDHRDGH
jgi:hypothetical protein